MIGDLLLQAGAILLTVFMFLAMHNIPQNLLTKIRLRYRSDLQAKRHFVAGAQLLSRAKSTTQSRSSAASLAKEAQSEADKAISIDPTDAAAHILRALALDLQGQRNEALDSLDAALAPRAVKSLSDGEKSDALVKRAELKMKVSRRGRVESAVEDLNRAVELSPENVKARCLLGECYEVKKMKEEARIAYEEALRIEPGTAVARTSLDRLNT